MTVGWYVHHHGSGHLHRFLAVRPHLPGVVGLSSLPRPAGVPPEAWIELPSDVPDGPPSDPTAHGALHWAPLDATGLRTRTARIAGWVDEHRPDALVVDVSVEVAVLGRLLGVPVVVVAQRGRRDDRAHALGYDAAHAVVAPWTARLHAPGQGLPDDRVVHCGAISRFDDRPSPPPSRTRAGGDVLLLVGSGGHAIRPDQVADAARASGRTWHVAGALRVADAADVVDHGPAADVATLLGRSDVVVATGGGNHVAEIAWARRRAVLVPQERPFDEQRDHARVLAEAGLVDVADAWPDPGRWRALLGRVEAIDPQRWRLLHDGRGAARLARLVASVVAREAGPTRGPAAVAA